MQTEKPRVTPVSTDEPARRLTRQYNLITFGGALTLISLVTVLFFYQFNSQREHELEIIRKKVDDRAATLDNFLAATPFYVQQLRANMEFQLRVGGDAQPGALIRNLPQQFDGYFAVNGINPPFTLEDLGNLFGAGDFEQRAASEEGKEIYAAMSLFPIFKAGHKDTPYFAWSYYQSVGRFTAMYPWAHTNDISGGDPSQNIVTVIDSVMDLDLMNMGRPSANPNRRAYWTPVYLDPGGKGLMITHGAPVYDQSKFCGVVGTDVTLSIVNKYADNLGFPNGVMIISNDLDQVLATNLSRLLDDSSPTALTSLLETLPDVDLASLTSFYGSRELGAQIVYRIKMESVPWTVTFLVPKSDLNSLTSFGMAGYLAILAGLAVFLGLIYVVLLRRFVKPAMALTDHIRAEAAEGVSHSNEISPLWQPWFKTVSDTFALKTVTSNLPGAIYQLKQDPDEGALVTEFISQGITELSGVDHEAVKHMGWEQLVVEEDRAQLLANIRQSARDLKPFFYECRLRTQRGGQKWIRLASRPRKETTGEVVWEGLLLDITKRKIAEAGMHAVEVKLRSILDGPLVPMVISNLDSQRITFINKRCAELFNTSVDEAMGNYGPNYWIDVPSRKAIFAEIREKGMVENFEARLMKQGGTHFWALLSAMPIEYRGESSLLITLIDITQRKKLEDDLKRAATTDFLSSAYNRRHFLELGRREFLRAKRHKGKLSVVMMDIDHFKNVNDTYGHPAGDECIRTVAQTCLHSIRSIDIFGRLGGEEFSAVLPETDLENAVKTSERLRQTIESVSVVYEGKQINFTVSLGVTQISMDDATIEDLLDRADKALYMAKNQGRNRTMVLEGDAQKTDT